MARQYAAIMASLGMAVVLVQAVRRGGGLESAVVSAMFWMIALGLIGFMVASIARNTVDEAVRQRIEQELNANHQAHAIGPAASG